MSHLGLSSKGVTPVTVDHCGDCRLVWFDALESVQLDGFGWVRLLRELQHGAASALPSAAHAKPACPHCSAPLKSVSNQTRFGHFESLECPRQHGHLQSHHALLAERGLVRALLGPERKALAEEHRQLHCLNCGAPADGSVDACGFCKTPLVVIDRPRLVHALHLELNHDGPSPHPRGQSTVWPCRSCGAPLDPVRDSQCPRCAHLIVVPSVLDITPILDAADTELSWAAESKAAQHAHPRRSAPNASRTPAASMGSLFMLGGWTPLLLALAVSALAVLLS